MKFVNYFIIILSLYLRNKLQNSSCAH